MRKSFSVLNINNYHYPRGGSDRYFLQLTDILIKAGHRVGTFSTNHNKTIHKDWLAVPPIPGVDTEHVGSMSNVLKYLYSPGTKRNMVNAISAFKPNIAHLHIYYGQLTASILAPLREAGIPTVQTLHEYKLVCPTHGLFADGKYCDVCKGRYYWHAPLKRCNRKSIARSLLSMTEAYISDFLGAKDYIDQFICVSKFQKKQLVRLGISEKKLAVVHHFADASVHVPDNVGEYFLYVGRIVREKGIGVLLEAYSLLGERRRPLKIVGAGAETELWQTYAQELGLKDQIEWLGFKDGNELNKLYEGALAVINPSMLNETFGLTCVEALARGRPVIASRVGAFPEVVSDGKDGILIPPSDPISLSKAMEAISSNSTNACNMGIKGRQNVRKKFSRQRHYEELMRIYNSVING